MFAVIETGGKQHIVELGTELEVELLDAEPGQEINLERVLFVADGETRAVGRPLVADGAVTAVVVRQDRGEKTISFKYRPKARRRVKKGHRQELTVLRITDVRLGDHSAAKDAETDEARAASEREKIAEAAARQAAEDAALAAKLAARAKKAETEAAEETAEAKPKRGRAKAAESEAPAESDAPVEEVVEGDAKAARKRASKADAEAEGEPVEAAESGEAGEPADAAETAEDQAPKKRARTKKDE